MQWNSSALLLVAIAALALFEVWLTVRHYRSPRPDYAVPQRVALVAAAATYLLLLLGGLVHNTRSSLACPDWPLCFGSAVPRMEGGVLYEHGHRLAATSVGALTVGLAALLGRHGRRRVVWGLFAVGLVVLQGVLGGITVIYRLPTLVSTAHLAVSLLFFCLLLVIALRLLERRAPLVLPVGTRRWLRLAAVVVYLQSVLGALMRHLGVGLACVDLPLCRGAVWPIGAHPSVLVHAGHRLVGLAVAAIVIVAAVSTWRAASQQSGRHLLRGLALALPGIVLVQIALGASSIVTFLDALPVTAHLGGAALLLASLTALLAISRHEAGERAQVATGKPVPV